VSLNVRRGRKVRAASASPAAGDSRGPEPFVRDAAIDDLIEEMTAWKPRERISAIRSWLKGSLSLIHLHVLSAIEADGPQPMSKLADMLDVSVASATGIVSRMEERHLVERQHDREDRRVVLVVPTEAGLSVFRTMNEQRRDRLRLLLGRLTDDELEGLRTGLRAIRVAREALHAEISAESPESGEAAASLGQAGQAAANPPHRPDHAGRAHR
jgi:DNA-binding MarR family transcriptional regulator